MRLEVAHRRIEAFGKRFGEAHLYLAYHAAFPLALTPDLLYRLWANFQRDIHGEVLNIPWIAVADFLLSSLCDEVGHELYEMEGTVRNALLNELKANPRFGTERINELSDFLLAYIQQQLDSPDIDTRDFAQAQKWTALAYVRPNEAAREIATALSRLKLEDRAEWVRMTSLVETFAEPLAEFEPLLIYTRGMADFTRGNQESAATQFSRMYGQQHKVDVAGVSLNLPVAIQNKHESSPWTEEASSDVQLSTHSSFVPSSNVAHIICVDDTTENLLALQAILEPEYKVDVTDSGSLALAQIEASLPDLVLLDVRMPEMDGYEVTRRIRQNVQLPFIPILMLADHENTSVVEALDMGANDCIRKPVEPQELLARVRSLLRLKRVIDERDHIARQFNSTLQEQQIQSTLLNYEDHEEEFLKAIATRCGFSGKTWLVFLERFREKNTDCLDKDIAAYLEAELIEGTNEGANPATILRDRLKAICDKLEAEGCDFQGVTKGRWKIAKRWLREVLYPEWLKQRHLIPLSCHQLWQQLWEMATPTDKLKPVLLKSLSNLEMGEAEMTEEESLSLSNLEMGEAEMMEEEPLCFSLHSKIRLEVNLDGAGYLLLLEKSTSGKIWCLCPSGFAPEPKHSGGRVSLPQASSRHKYFKLTGSPGQEEIVAVITKDVPRLDWLPQPGEPLLQLREGHLTGLLEYLNLTRDCQVLRLTYRVTADLSASWDESDRTLQSENSAKT